MTLDFPLKPLAHRLAERHWKELRFLPRLNRWLRLDELSGVWRPDDGRVCLKAARELVQEAADAARNINLSSSANVDAVMRARLTSLCSRRRFQTTNCSQAFKVLTWGLA